MKGGQVQSFASARAVSVSDQAGVGERMASAPTAATWLRFTDISFTRTNNPAGDRASNDHHGKGKTECHSQKSLKMRTIEMASTFFR